MSTVNQPYMKNITASTVNNSFNVIWNFTRALLKGGYWCAASSNGTTKDTTGAPDANKWNVSGAGTITNAGGASAVVAAASRGRSAITGLTGIVAADKGRYFVDKTNNKTYQIEEITSSTAIKVSSRVTAISTGTVSWEIRDPQSDAYSGISGTLASASCWECLVGPSTIWIPFTVQPSGTFLPGENVIQSTTGAEGEFLGKYWNGSSSGWIAIAPRVRGVNNPTTAQGWDTGNTITGSNSGATVSQNGTAKEFVNEIVFWKSNLETTGTVFWGHFDTVTDATERFSYLAANAAGCTATVAPGGGGTGNSFPAHGVLEWGATTSGSHMNWFGEAGLLGNAQACVNDAIPESGYSADGSWTVLISTTGTPSLSRGLSFQYLVDTERGDACPYAFLRGFCTSSTLYANTRAGSLTANTTSGVSNLTVNNNTNSTGFALWNSWRRRGLSGERYCDVEIEALTPHCTAATFNTVHAANTTVPAKLALFEDTPYLLEKFRLGSYEGTANVSNYRFRKGQPKWLRIAGYGSIYQTYQDEDDSSKYWLQTATMQSAHIPLCIGPWGGGTDAVAY